MGAYQQRVASHVHAIELCDLPDPVSFARMVNRQPSVRVFSNGKGNGSTTKSMFAEAPRASSPARAAACLCGIDPERHLSRSDPTREYQVCKDQWEGREIDGTVNPDASLGLACKGLVESGLTCHALLRQVRGEISLMRLDALVTQDVQASCTAACRGAWARW